MNEEYDAIICGTGLTECVLSGLLATHGHKVLHVDRNPFYGGEGASLNLEQLYAKFDKGAPPAELGQSHQYNVDLVPKVLMCAGELVKILRATVVDRYSMEFMLIENSFVMKGGKIHKVPVTESEALSSGLMGFFEKRSAAKFFGWLQEYEPEDPKTHKGHDLTKMTMAQLFKAFSLGNDTIDFVGHAVALHNDDAYLQQPALPTVMKAKLYEESFDMYGSSPYVYPLYGLGELPQCFSRLCAVYGGTYMLGTPVEKVNYNADGQFESIESGGQTAKAKMIIGDPSYFPERRQEIGQCIRCIALMDHPIATGNKTETNSMQIIIPQKELKRSHDIYILQMSDVNKVCPKGKYIAIVGTVVENQANPNADIEAGLKLLGTTIETFTQVTPIYAPKDDGVASKTFVSQSFDSSTHFEAAAADILNLFERAHGKPYNFDSMKGPEEGGAAGGEGEA